MRPIDSANRQHAAFLPKTERPTQRCIAKQGIHFTRRWACEELNLGPHAYQAALKGSGSRHHVAFHRADSAVCPESEMSKSASARLNPHRNPHRSPRREFQRMPIELRHGATSEPKSCPLSATSSLCAVLPGVERLGGRSGQLYRGAATRWPGTTGRTQFPSARSRGEACDSVIRTCSSDEPGLPWSGRCLPAWKARRARRGACSFLHSSVRQRPEGFRHTVIRGIWMGLRSGPTRTAGQVL